MEEKGQSSEYSNTVDAMFKFRKQNCIAKTLPQGV